MAQPVTLSIVMPVFNEEPVIGRTYERLRAVLDSLGETHEIILVNDGSRDGTLDVLRGIARADRTVRIISLTRNYGQQAAITAGLAETTGRAVVVMDADLQDPPELLTDMVRLWREGYQVVNPRRIERQGDSLAKRASAAAFYAIIDRLSPIRLPRNVGDFRLIDRRVVDFLNGLEERNRYIRGLVTWSGFRTADLPFVRHGRAAGDTKYNLGRLIRLSLDGILSFSYKPLRMAIWIGFALSLASFGYLLVVLWKRLFTDLTVPGWSSLMAVNLFCNGMLFIMLGILGEYVARISDQVKGRPLYLVAERIGFEDGDVEAKRGAGDYGP
jgi:glycosyltransferase involved in cell wall biosynthesis